MSSRARKLRQARPAPWILAKTLHQPQPGTLRQRSPCHTRRQAQPSQAVVLPLRKSGWTYWLGRWRQQET
jgi:hypothetical protein